mmetsp:Transcript_22076/g.54040  ORF Transcript_22076/g.54040 Transcript_22076/m.54040 type:complete len:219 (+) Transcript_22076:285-941(+)
MCECAWSYFRRLRSRESFRLLRSRESSLLLLSLLRLRLSLLPSRLRRLSRLRSLLLRLPLLLLRLLLDLSPSLESLLSSPLSSLSLFSGSVGLPSLVSNFSSWPPFAGSSPSPFVVFVFSSPFFFHSICATSPSFFVSSSRNFSGLPSEIFSSSSNPKTSRSLLRGGSFPAFSMCHLVGILGSWISNASRSERRVSTISSTCLMTYFPYSYQQIIGGS